MPSLNYPWTLQPKLLATPDDDFKTSHSKRSFYSNVTEAFVGEYGDGVVVSLARKEKSSSLYKINN